MRKYRGKRKDSGEWVKGWRLETEEGSRILEIGLCDEDIYCGFNWPEVKIPNSDSGCHEVIPSSVSQSTGREDKNGDEIFGGHIVKHDNKIRPAGTFRVEWDKYKAGWVLSGVGRDKAGWLRDWSADFVEIIGNITDNPELLEAQQ